MKRPLVSIIVPVYNVEAYLEHCIESLLKQTYENIEIILIDDGSTDNSSTICDKYEKQYNQIKVIHQENKGLPGARNTGMKHVNGEWVLFVDSDDWLSLDAVESIISSVDDKSADFIIFEHQRMQSFNEIAVAEGESTVVELSKEDLNLLLQDVVSPSHRHCKRIMANCVMAWNKAYRRSFLVDNGLLFDEEVKIHEDVPFATKVFKYAVNGAYLEKKCYQYRFNNNSIMTSYKKDYVKRIAPLISKMQEIMLVEFEDKKLGARLFDERICILIAQCMERYFCNPQNTESYKKRKLAWKKMLGEPVFSSSIKNTQLCEFTLKKRVIILCIKIKCFFIPEIYYRWLNK